VTVVTADVFGWVQALAEVVKRLRQRAAQAAQQQQAQQQQQQQQGQAP
jgi:hypothetical protein